MTAYRNPHIRLWIDGVEIEQPTDWVLQLEVEESVDEASTFKMTLDMSPIEGDWDLLEHGRFAEDNRIPDFSLLQRVTVEFSLVGSDETEPAIRAVVIDGYVTCVEPVYGEERSSESQLVLSGMEASCLMHFETVTREWHGLTDAQIAQAIFQKYSFGFSSQTIEETAPLRDADRASLVQRCTDAEFLQLLARRNGFEWYLEPAQGDIRPGSHPAGSLVGHFHSPRPHADAQPPLQLFPHDEPSLIEYRARWECHQPACIRSWHIDEVDRRIQRADVTEPGYEPLNPGGSSRARIIAARFREIFSSGNPPRSLDIQSRDVPHNAQEVVNLARALYREVDWFVVGQGTVRCELYPAIVRAGRPIELTGAGHLLDGRWYVKRVRHRWARDFEEPEQEPVTRRYEADVTLVRNDLGGTA